MTRTKKLLMALADGVPMSVKALSEATGFDRVLIIRSLDDLRQAGFIETQPATHLITPAGIAKRDFKPKGRAKAAPKKPIKPRAIAARRIPADTMVSKSIQGRPALEKFWGAAA